METSDLKELVVISSVIGENVNLKRSSANRNRWMGLCPFHSDKNPSFCVDDSWGRYKCFSCGKDGDVITYLHDYRGMGYKEALTELKVRAGVVDEFLTAKDRAERESLFKRLSLEKKEARKWRASLRDNLIIYINCQWKIYRTAKRELLRNQTEELERQASMAFFEATRREAAVDELDYMTDADLMGYYKTRASWEGLANPAWCLGGRRLKMVNELKMVA